MLSVQFFEHRKPLFELVELGAAVSKVDDHLARDVAAVELVFETVPPFCASDPLARSLPSRRLHRPEGSLAEKTLQSVPFA